MTSKTVAAMLMTGALAIVLPFCSPSSDAPDAPDAGDAPEVGQAEPSIPSFEEEKQVWEAAVALELTELERDLGDLRMEAERTDEDFSAEFVHLDDLMSELEDRLKTAQVSDARELERLRVDTQLALAEIKEQYAHLESRVNDAAERSPVT